jgi:hypothetical protein
MLLLCHGTTSAVEISVASEARHTSSVGWNPPTARLLLLGSGVFSLRYVGLEAPCVINCQAFTQKRKSAGAPRLNFSARSAAGGWWNVLCNSIVGNGLNQSDRHRQTAG